MKIINHFFLLFSSFDNGNNHDDFLCNINGEISSRFVSPCVLSIMKDIHGDEMKNIKPVEMKIDVKKKEPQVVKK